MISTVATVLAAMAVVLVLAIAVALAVPVDVDLGLRAGVEADARPLDVRVRVGWLRWTWRSDAPRRSRPARPSAPRPPRRSVERRGRGLSGVAMLRSPGFPAAARRLAADLARVIRPREASGVVYVGLDDPASTGAVYGWLQAVEWPVRGQGGDLRVVPLFDEARLAADADLHWRIRPASVVGPVVAFGVRPATWRAVRAGWRARRTG
ncbi:MAG: hypothetical protein R2745_07775 [Vicinamibacterales bacterium]